VVGNAVMDLIEMAARDLKDFVDKQSTRSRNRATRTVRRILKESAPKYEYSAIVATIVAEHDDFQAICVKMRECGLWDAELEDLYCCGLRNSCSKIRPQSSSATLMK
jgi:hypothetical protein